MSDSSTATANPSSAPPEVWIGLDWGDYQHAFALQDGRGQQASGKFPHSAEALHQWLQKLGQQYRSGWLILEGRPAHVVSVLVQYPWLTLYPINPIASERFRRALTPSGASDDLPDARALLDLLRAHADRLRPWEPQDAATERLERLVQARRDMVDRRTQLVVKTKSLLKGYYPQALELAGQLDSVLASRFLRQWPDLLSLQAAKPATLKRFYYRQRVRSQPLITQRLERIAQARPLTTEPGQLEVSGLQLRQLLDELEGLQEHIAHMDRAVAQAFKDHPEAYLFRELPGAGPQMAPRLCVAFGTDRTRYPSAESLQKYAGVAPVIEKSGKHKWVHWRWNAPKFLRQTFVEWAGLSTLWSVWAKRYYQHMTKKGKPHAVIIRALAFKWLRVLWKCWQSQTPYDETRYLKTLTRRKSPYAT